MQRAIRTWLSRVGRTDLPGYKSDGNDVEAIHSVAGEAIQRARAGGGPTLLECRTYRTRPHAEGMGDFTYRTRDEVAAWRPLPHSTLPGRARRGGMPTPTSTP